MSANEFDEKHAYCLECDKWWSTVPTGALLYATCAALPPTLCFKDGEEDSVDITDEMVEWLADHPFDILPEDFFGYQRLKFHCEDHDVLFKLRSS